MQRFSLLVIIVVLLIVPCASRCKKTPGATTNAPVLPQRLSATFIQLIDGHRTWSKKRWNDLFDHLANLGIDELIIQWSVYEGRPFYGKRENDVLSTVLKIAERRGMQVWIGLVYDAAYWTHIQETAVRLHEYLEASQRKTRKIAEELIACVGRPSNIVGWYISQEIDDLNFMSKQKRRVLANYLKELSASLRQVAPNFSVAISAYTGFHATPDSLRVFWSDIIETTSIDTVFFQDGVGVRKTAWKTLESYFLAVQRSVKKRGRHLRIVVELFEQVDGPPINELPFRAIPAPWSRIQNQMRLAFKYSDGNVAAFSFPEYATPSGGKRAGQLYKHFMKYKRCTQGKDKMSRR